jgi:hypothetical protein
VCVACFRFIDHRAENELPENFQDIDFKDIKQQQVGFDGPVCGTFNHVNNAKHRADMGRLS